MIDVHCHILYGLDDSIQTKEEMKAMFKVACADGIEAIVATPHIHYSYPNTREMIAQKYEEAIACIQENKFPLQLFMGSEFFLSERTSTILHQEAFVPYANTNHVLVEMPWKKADAGEDVEGMLRAIIEQGYQPIIAHPERYFRVLEDYQLLYKWKEMGCFLQVNSTSILGHDKMTETKDLAWRMMRDDLVDVVASDSHGPFKNRPPMLRDVYAIIEREFGRERAERYMEDMPRRLLNI